MRPGVAFVATAVAVTACSWSRFDDLENNPPIVLLSRPGKMRAGFGVSVAAASAKAETVVIVGGASGKSIAALFNLGTDTTPATDAVDTGSCSQDTPCLLATHPAALGSANVGSGKPKALCFVLGIGNADKSASNGLTARCFDGSEYTIPIPRSAVRGLSDLDDTEQIPEPLLLATDKDSAPALVAGAPTVQLAWFYEPLSVEPVALVPPGTPDSDYGASVAVLRVAAGDAGGASRRVFAVGAPSEGHVFLFGEDGSPIGCFGGIAGFGKALASGHVDADDNDDLVVSDGVNVTAISGAALGKLAPSTDIACTFAALPSAAILASFGCGSRGAVAGCPGSFGAALDVGDLDGDGDGEILVGAPDLRAHGANGAGAVLVYDAEGAHPEELTDELFLSSAEGGDRLGATVAAASIHGRDVVVAGVPGSGRTAVFYCSNLLPKGAGGNRCQ